MYAKQGLRLVPWVLLTAIWWAISFQGLGERSLYSSHEGRAGQHAELMLTHGKWMLPELYWGSIDYQKPPLYYWMVAAVGWMRSSVDEIAVRSPASISALLGIWLFYGFALTRWRSAIAFLVSAGLATSLRYVWLSRVGRIDMPMTLCISLGMMLFWFGYTSRSRKNRIQLMLGAYSIVAVGVLLKGPVAFVLPAASITMFICLDKKAFPWEMRFWQSLRDIGVHWGLILILCVGGAWYTWATVKTDGEFFTTFFIHHNLNRSLGTEGLKAEPIWYYVPQIFLAVFPWSVLVPFAFFPPLKRDRRSWLFGLSWFGAMFVVLSLVRFKRHDYLLPTIPGILLLIGCFWNRLWSPRVRREKRIAISLLSCTVIALTIGLFLGATGPVWVDSAESLSVVSPSFTNALRNVQASSWVLAMPILGSVVIGGWGIYWFQVSTRSVAQSQRLEIPSRIAFQPIFLGGTSLLMVWCLVFVFYTNAILPGYEPMRSQRTVAIQARSLAGPDGIIMCYGREDHQIMFYSGMPIQRLADRHELRGHLESPEPVFIIADKQRLMDRQREWTDVDMFIIDDNTTNSFENHVSPMVIVTNRAGLHIAQRRLTPMPLAN